MSANNPFVDEWRECLREHFKYIIREQDSVTERSLVTVMHEVGFDDAELAELRVLATMRAEDMPDDYVPQEVFQSPGVDLPASEVVEAAAPEPEEEAVPVDVAEVSTPAPDEVVDDGPKQMSLF